VVERDLRLVGLYTTADDRNRIEAVIRRGYRAGQYPVDGPAAAQLRRTDDVLFSRIQNSAHHVLHVLSSLYSSSAY